MFCSPTKGPSLMGVACSDTGDGWADFGPQFAEGLGGQAKFVFPTAPIRPITLNGGYKMNGWVRPSRNASRLCKHWRRSLTD